MSKSKEWAPSSSKPYLVHELLPVWGGITEDDRLVHVLSHCHGNNSCNQSAPSGRRSLPGMLLRVNVVAGLTPRRNPPLKRCAWARTEEETRDAFFAVSALWIEGNRSSPVLTPPTSSVPPWAHPCSLSSSRPPPPRPTDLCFCECYSVKPSLVERFFCPMLVMHMCKKPRPLTLIPAEIL